MTDKQLANGVNINFSMPDVSSIHLHSNDTRNLLDVVDNLRSQGINRYIDLPQIIVCGEQSSGKSSVLEAISGLMFPSKDNLCTRFATELILRRGPPAPIKIRIMPGSEQRSESELQRLADFGVSVSHQDLRLGEVIESAKEAMGINDADKVFSSDILRLEVSGPEQPHLTLVDLPGLFEAGSSSQSDADIDTVKSLVLSYMERPRSIILAVVSAKSEFNNQSITRYARKIDTQGLRTLGLITKPDTLDEGSDSEAFYIRLAQNKDVKFRLGWHVLRNRDYASRNSSLQERHRAEEQFFSTGAWKSLSPTSVGVHSLKPRLGKILKDQITAQLPAVLNQIQDGIQESKNILNLLGPSRATFSEQQRYLLQISQSFSSLVKAAVDGSYYDPYFGSAATAEGYQKRLRAVLQNTLSEFAEAMRRRGYTFQIVDETIEESAEEDPWENIRSRPKRITRRNYLSKVKTLLKRSRGRELPGTFDPLIIGDLFHEQRKPWAALVDEYMEKIISAIYTAIHATLSHITTSSTKEELLRRFIHPGLERLTSDLRIKVQDILRPHETGHPITYNHYLTETVQNAQDQRFRGEVRKSLSEFFGYGQGASSHKLIEYPFELNSLIDTLVGKHKADMDEYACSTATDFMEAYYKVALKKVIDDISVLAVEACLMIPLPTLFAPEMVLDIGEEEVAAIAAEEEHSAEERARSTEKLRVLENGLRELKTMQEYSSALTDQPSAIPYPASDIGESSHEDVLEEEEPVPPESLELELASPVIEAPEELPPDPPTAFAIVAHPTVQPFESPESPPTSYYRKKKKSKKGVTSDF
ncbi:dynamin family protein [Periconia macrospinosa]|uniref:Dynamin family protein n=1 Tax=Periconia macrospinosa TaxID=97972 RepID=A0A2V1DM58_9PLEO|nr:dynamin family protein [Periconia macrospinosa]